MTISTTLIENNWLIQMDGLHDAPAVLDRPGNIFREKYENRLARADKMADWFGRTDLTNFSELIEAMHRPWAYGQNVVDRMHRDLDGLQINKPKSHRRRVRFSEDDGAEICYDRLRSGNPFWRTTRRQLRTSLKPVSVLINIGGNGGRTADELLWAASAGISTVEVLEAAGIRAEVFVCDAVSRCWHNCTRGGLFSMQVKAASDPLDRDTLIAATSPWFFRNVFFSAHTLPADDCSEGLGRHASLESMPTLINRVCSDPRRIIIENCYTRSDAGNAVRNAIGVASAAA
ncbi:DUF7192 family protein [Roseimaritima ulvae]|uniref:DUF7192 domain-containing protein n=1 Tax=Roseimaritima ulvae TaxID=980254 RepID=A0A5B9R935_9BACT|nr:hypothetical protein [Roseimaritima ulvae]QEG43451.1 hypothetical protein UC8_55000 [Roseimaritima ulvae]